MKDELGVKILTKFSTLRTKISSYLIGNNDKNKNQKHKKCVIKQRLKSEDYKNCWEARQFKNKMNQPEKVNFVWILLEKIIKNS